MEVEQDQRITAEEAISHEWYGLEVVVVGLRGRVEGGLVLVGAAHPSRFPQDLWQRRLRQEHQGWCLCPDREELCPGQVEGGCGVLVPQFPLSAEPIFPSRWVCQSLRPC